MKYLESGERGALDKFEGSDKQGKSDSIIKTNLGFVR
jgi:hypothetical protein